MEASARSGAVIHSGLYQPQGSLKACACVRVRQPLYKCAALPRIRVRRTGKLIVASSSEELGTRRP
jgi:L-2-hydroxyglutarate oxidase LhgO